MSQVLFFGSWKGHWQQFFGIFDMASVTTSLFKNRQIPQKCMICYILHNTGLSEKGKCTSEWEFEVKLGPKTRFRLTLPCTLCWWLLNTHGTKSVSRAEFPLICISVRHLDRAPAFACSSNRPISRHGRHAAFYPSYNTSDLGLYPGIQPFLRGYHQVRHTHQIFIKFDKGLRGPAHAICWWVYQKSCQQFTWRPTQVTLVFATRVIKVVR